MGPVGEVETGDLHGRSPCRRATARGDRRSRLHTSVAPTRPAPSQCVHSSTMLASTVGSASASVRRDAAGEVDRQRLARPLDAVPGGDPLRRRQAHPAPTEALHDEGAGVDRQVHGRRLVLPGAVEADEALAAARRRAATNDDRPSARRRATASGMSRDVDDLERSGRLAAHRVGRGQERAVAGRDALVGVRVAGVVQLGQQRAPGGRRRSAARCPRRRARCAAAACGARGRRARAASSSRRPACPTTAQNASQHSELGANGCARSAQPQDVPGDEPRRLAAQPGDDGRPPRRGRPRGGARSTGRRGPARRR